MRIRVDRKNDALYFRLDESKIVESEEIQPGVILDYDKDERIIGIEFLSISSRTSEDELSSIQFNAA